MLCRRMLRVKLEVHPDPQPHGSGWHKRQEDHVALGYREREWESTPLKTNIDPENLWSL